MVSDKVETPVDFRLLRMRGDWWVYDVVVDGISVVSNYRSQFARILHSSSYADLVEQLRKRVEGDLRPDRSSSLQRPWISLCVMPYASERSFSGNVRFRTHTCRVAPSECASPPLAARITIFPQVTDL